MKLLILGLLLSFSVIAGEADRLRRPHSFKLNQGTAVFVDFQEATYQINYNLNEKSATIMADIRLYMPEAGYPIFDSVTAPRSIFLNGESVSATEVSTPNNETKVRVVNKFITEGSHRLTIVVPLTTLIDFQNGGVKSAFWTSDLQGRSFLERYMPANLEYDQVKMTFIVRFFGNKNKQNIYTNGQVEQKDDSTYVITYPRHYNASSVFFHTVPKESVEELRFSIKSIDGRELPAVVYAAKSLWGSGMDNLIKFKNATTSIIQELESDYGAFPHPSITIYNAGSGGMEYCGATMTEMRALGHELFHSYFARGVMPANGNAGWLDEALASWRDEGYQSISTLSGSSRMSAHPYYTRQTDRAAYSFGERFMSLLDGKLKAKGGLKPFLRYMVDKKIFAPLFVEEFIKEMGSFYGISVEQEFKQYTFGIKNDFPTLKMSVPHHHEMHQKMNLSELKNYL